MKRQIIYELDGKDYTVNIFYKQMRNIHYRFINGEFKVTCPPLTTNKAVIDGLNKFARKLVQKAHDQELYTDEFIYVFGHRCYLTFPSGEINFTNYPTLKYDSKEQLERKLKKLLLEYITKRVRYYEDIMGINDHYNVRVRVMKTRYGTNSVKTHTLTFAWMLVHYEPEIIDTVVVHELCHYFYFDHSKNFYNTVYKYCPDYDTIQKKLKKGIRND